MSMVTCLDMPIQQNDFFPILKYDARAGKLLISNRDVTESLVQRDITSKQTMMIFDLGSIQVGPVCFSKVGPVRQMVPMESGYSGMVFLSGSPARGLAACGR